MSFFKDRRVSAVFIAFTGLCAAFGLAVEWSMETLDPSALDEISRQPASGEERTVDLHAHLFMKAGMTWFIRGRFNGPLQAKDWSSRFSSQANPETVERSQIGILVVSLYAHPLLTWSVRNSIRKQIDLAEQFVLTHPQWVIARSALEAREAIDQGKRVMVLALEGASSVLETEEDLKEFVDRRGVRIVTFLHLTDDHLGGVAFMRSYHAMSTPIRWFIELFSPTFTDGVKVNAQGLTDDGRKLAQSLIARKVWLDLSHSSDAAQVELTALLEKAGHPLLYTHGGIRKFYRAERAISEAQLQEVHKTDGLVGICPSEDFVEDTPVPIKRCGGPGCPVPCNNGLPAFIEHYSEAVRILGPANVLIGSDFNGAIPHLRPSCGTGTELDREGLWNIGQMGQFWAAMRQSHAPVPDHLSDQIESFLAKWSRVTD